MNNFLYFKTPISDYPVYYPNIQTPFVTGKEIFTQLPNNIAIIRTIAIIAFTSLIVLNLKTTIFCYTAALAGIVLAAWTIYSHLLSTDPLIESFYKITGGKDRFQALPEINLVQAPNEKIYLAIGRINWEELNHQIARSKTLDGRNVIIIKGLSRNQENLFMNGPTKTVLAFIEKISPNDSASQLVFFSESVYIILHAINIFSKNTFGTFWKDTIYAPQPEERSYELCSFISSNQANELFTQLAIPP
ncbi:MAG: hypothetical protein H0V82_00110 [Candidatus Protochlamydia sp.]|nr:hypothetical protein [Candidatus Protochlamydia sp.]